MNAHFFRIKLQKSIKYLRKCSTWYQQVDFSAVLILLLSDLWLVYSVVVTVI